MEYKVKRISTAGIAEAIAKAELYRSLNEPEEAESICRDILAIEPQHQLALRLLGLALTDQFTGHGSDRYRETEEIFRQLKDPYERLYYTGITARAARESAAQGRATASFTVQRSSTMLYTLSQRLRKSVRQETTMPSFAGIVACDCFKIQPMNGMEWNRNSFPSMPRKLRRDSKSPPTRRMELQSEDAEQPLQGIEVTVHHALFERNDRVLGNRNRLRTHLPATSGDVAVTDVVLVPQIADPVFGIKRMHFERSGIDEQTRTDKLVVLVVFSQDVAHVLAEKTLDALAKLLHALDVGLLHAPCAIGRVGWAWLELLDRLLGPEIPRNIRDQIAYDRKRMHWLQDDRHIQVDVT